MTAALPSGRTPASTSAALDPDLPGYGGRDPLVVAGEQHGTQTKVTEPRHRGPRARPQLVRDRQRGAGLAVPPDEDRGPAVVRCGLDGVAERGRHLNEQLGEQLRAADGNVPVLDAASHPGTRQGREPGDLRQAAEPGGGRAGDGLADRVLRSVFDGAGQQQRLPLALPRPRRPGGR